MKTNIQILPSLLAAPTGYLAEHGQRAIAAGADGLHIDIMDAHFVPNLSFGPNVVQMAREEIDCYLSVHLMMDNPQDYIRPFIQAGADLLLIHIEPDYNVRNALRDIRSMGVKAGITLNPETAAESIYAVLDGGLVDEVLVMAVHPGFGGQSFISDVLSKVRNIRDRSPDTDISIDGGINLDNCVSAARDGANVMVAGTALFASGDMPADIQEMRSRAAQSYRGA